MTKTTRKPITKSEISKFQIGESLIFQGKNLKPRKILREILDDKKIMKYLNNESQHRYISAIPSYIN